VFGYLRRRAQLKGVVGGSRGWTLLWAALTGVRLLRRVTSDKPEVVYTHKLRPGEALVIRSERPETTTEPSPPAG
jgi:hypothetical protein